MNEDQSPDQADPKRPLRELAEEVLQKEKAAPGSQDPEFVRWATDTLNGTGTAVPASATSPTLVQPSQPAGPSLGNDNEGVLQIQQTPGQTIQPTNKPTDGQGTT
jgi:hypothetical protein